MTKLFSKWIVIVSLLVIALLIGIASQPTSAEQLASNGQSPRKGNVTITLRDESGTPWSNVSIGYTQITHEFLFGVGTRATRGQLPQKFFAEFRQIGLNSLMPTVSWGLLEPSPGTFDWRYIDRLDPGALQKQGYTFFGHLLIFWREGHPDLPNYLKPYIFDELDRATYTHVSAVVEHYRGVIKYWGINEPNDPRTDYFHLSQSQWIEIMRTAGRAIRAKDPEAKILINLVVDERVYSPHRFLDALVAHGVEFDVIGLEIYDRMVPSDVNGYPSIGASQSKIESFARFNKPILITEIAVPDRPSTKVQSEWLRSFYAMAYEIPSVQGIFWFYTVDDPFMLGAGLFPNENSDPRPIYNALGEIIQERTTDGTTKTDSRGIMRIEGYAGDYQIQVDDGAQRTSFSIHITERKDNSILLVAPTPTPTVTPVPTPTHTATATPKPTATPTQEPTSLPKSTVAPTVLGSSNQELGWVGILLTIVIAVGLVFGISRMARQRK
jgi:hypothetical protein